MFTSTTAFLEENRLGKYITPQIFPDELVHGYLARFALQNGLHDFKFTKMEVGYTFLDQLNFKPVREYLEVIEKLTGYSAGYLIRQHTLNHLTRFRFTLLNNVFQTDKNLLSAKLTKKYLYFCEGCAKADYQKLGLSYWRISHQLYSIDFCYKHHEWLTNVPLDTVYNLMPHQISAVFPHSRYIDLCDLILNERIQKYSSTTLQFLSERVLLDLPFLRKHLQKKAENLEMLFITSNGRIHKLPEYLTSVYPLRWLQKYFSNLMLTDDSISKSKQKFRLNQSIKYFDVNSILLVASAIDPDIDLLNFDSQVELKRGRYQRVRKKLKVTQELS